MAYKEIKVGPLDRLSCLSECFNGLIWNFTRKKELFALVKAVMGVESGFNPLAVSPTGAEGLAQFTDSTWEMYDPNKLDPFDEHDIFQATQGMAAMCGSLWSWAKRISPADWIEFVVASYNAGQGNVMQARARAEKAGGNPAEWEAVDPHLEALLVEKKGPEKGKRKAQEYRAEIERVLSKYDEYLPTAPADAGG